MSDRLRPVDLQSVDVLLDAVESMPSSWAPPGFVIDSGETDDHPTHDNVYCHRHARWVASRERKRTKCEMHVADISWGETDSTEWCAYPGCRRELDTGSLTEYGVDSALALTETTPLKSNVTPYELKRSAWSMSHDDPRWGMWIRQALRVIPPRMLRNPKRDPSPERGAKERG